MYKFQKCYSIMDLEGKPFDKCHCTQGLSQYKVKMKDAARFWKCSVLIIAPILLLPIILQNDTQVINLHLFIWYFLIIKFPGVSVWLPAVLDGFALGH